ncbi:MAG: UDP-N-acetylmuramoyl-L-alanyl-D-glutamate--2,6-diaminopimelate ligase [Ignavibacteriaceae bacterium]|nr:UDP-N-acetylmuramoyl-L-alanyl-D-glutamate--2,6-diaminopimelate ligase [Ignavibacteriaceae bacterium]
MELSKLINSIRAISVTGEVERKDITGIEYDSRKVQPGSVFVAIRGFSTDGHRFVMQAIEKGAVVVVVEDDNCIPNDLIKHRKLTKICVENSRDALSKLSHSYYKEPSKLLKIIGITGTNGKTTTTYIIKHILESLGHKTGLIGTIANWIGSEKKASSLTTPEASDLMKLLYEMYQAGCEYAVMEVSSHSLLLKRAAAIDFSAAIFSNITSDHLDFHGDFENYLAAKKILFDGLKDGVPAIYNSDDPSAARLLKDCAGRKISYGRDDDSVFRISNISFDMNGTSFEINYNQKKYNINVPLVGAFNAYNATSAFAAAVLSGVNGKDAARLITSAPQVPGRFEIVRSGAKYAIVDYSHTADSLEKTLLNIREIVGNSRKVYTVFGCGGDRDRTKRPIMGRIASELSDEVVVTNDNPRNEDPGQILSDITQGISGDNYVIISDREHAIKHAIENSDPDSVVLIAGKGHENYIDEKGVKSYFSDKETAKKYLGVIE